jgi:hypothetical protein
MLRLLALILLTSSIALGQVAASINGITQDCFAGKIIHPQSVDVYALNPEKSPEIISLLTTMKKQSSGSDQNINSFFASYEKLTSAIKKTAALGHTKSNQTGEFFFRNLKSHMDIVIVGIAEREDEPAYYTSQSLKLKPRRNTVLLDFDQGNPCKKP